MEKFQNFLNSIGGGLNNFRKGIGLTTGNLEKFGNFMGNIPSQEDVDFIKKDFPRLDEFKTKEQLAKENKRKDALGNIRDMTTGEIINKETPTTGNGKIDPSKPPSFEDIMGMDFKSYLGEVAKIGEEAKNKDMLRSGIASLAYSPLIGSQAAMESAANISKLTGVNMAAIANQGDVMAQNPTKQKIAGRYFR